MKVDDSQWWCDWETVGALWEKSHSSPETHRKERKKKKKGKKKKKAKKERKKKKGKDREWEGMRDFLCKHFNHFAWSQHWVTEERNFSQCKMLCGHLVFFIRWMFFRRETKCIKHFFPVISDSFLPFLSLAFTLVLFLFIPCKYNGE